MEPQPLVSIVVITYNSSKYVLETLESAKAQTYQNIEMIVSDDCSVDNTVEICRKWLEENKDRFVKTELITVEKNTGIPANANRGVKVTQGEWFKLIAGDDILLPNAIKEYVQFVNENKEAKLINTPMICFGENIMTPYIIYNRKTNDVNKQLKYLLQDRLRVNTASVFYNKDMFNQLGGFNEKYFLFEDIPFFIKALDNRKRFYSMSNPLVKYRIHKDSVFNSYNTEFNQKKLNLSSLFNEDIIYPFLIKNKLFITYLLYKWQTKIDKRVVQRGKVERYDMIQYNTIQYIKKCFFIRDSSKFASIGKYIKFIFMH